MNHENQVRHFLAGVAGSNAGSNIIGARNELGLYVDEINDIRTQQGGSWEDVRLYERAFQLVGFLNGNPAVPNSGHPLSEAGSWVQEHLGP